MSEVWEHYIEILTDPAHVLVEVTFIAGVDILFLGMLWPFIKRHFRKKIDKEHAKIDAEHGISHDEHNFPTFTIREDGSIWCGDSRVLTTREPTRTD